ncbi:MAG: ferredoxin [Actinobacteria bacterium]|nr:ferredoxin [Actinomycetota bacterium]
MKVIVDRAACEANAVCESIAPEVFRVNDDDELEILEERPGEELREKVAQAIRRCPKLALSIAED